MKTAKREIEDLIIRLDQAEKDGKKLIGPKTVAHALILVLKALNEQGK